MRELFRRQPRFTTRPATPGGPAVPDGLWVQCPKCKELTYSREFERLLNVCPQCGHHLRLNARTRLQTLVDDGSFEEWDSHLVAADPLNFVAGDEAYREKIDAVVKKTGEREALATGLGTIARRLVVLAVAEFDFLGASMGSVFGEKLTRAVERATDQRLPVVTISSSGGARMHESPFSLMQMAKTAAAFGRFSDTRLPHIAILTDPCYGGVTASYTTIADVIIAEPGAMIGFAGPRVIEQITRQRLPDGFQTAEFLLAHGMIDLVVPRHQLSAQVATLLEHYARPPDRASVSSIETALITESYTDQRATGD